MRHPRVLDRAAQTTEPQGFEEGTTPLSRAAGTETSPRAFAQEATQPLLDVAVKVMKLRRRIARAKVLTPPTEDGIQIRDDGAEVLVTP